MEWAPCIGAPGRHRHHLRRARLPGPDRHEAAHRLLVGGPHGLRDARHRHPHRLRPQRRRLRHGRPRPHHRHALLHRRLGEGAVPHPRDQAPRRPARSRRPQHGLDPRLLRRWRRSACPAWPGSGASSPPSSRPTTRRRACPRSCSAPTWSIAAVGTVLAAGYLLWLLPAHRLRHAQGGVRRRAHPRRARRPSGWRGSPMLVADPRARRLPEPHLPRHRPRRDRDGRHLRRRWASSRSCSPPCAAGRRRSPRRTSTTTRSRPRSCSPAPSCVVLLADLVHAGGLARHRAADRRHRAARPRSSRCSRWPSTAPTGSMFGGAYVGRQLRAGAQGAVPRSPATSWCCCPPTTSPRATTARASTTSCCCRSILGMMVMASSRDLIRSSSPSSCCRSPPTCSPAGASATCTATRRALKYYLMGVFASAVMLYGMSLLFGLTGSTLLADIGAADRRRPSTTPLITLGIVLRGRRLRLQGLGRAVPHLGARHLRGRAHADHRVPGGARRRPPASSPCSS